MFSLTFLFTLIPPVLAQVEFLSANTLVLGMGFVVLLLLLALLVRVMLIKQPAEPIPVSPPPVAEKQAEVHLYGELVVMDGMSGTKRILVNKEEFSIGRGLEFNDYELNLPGISRQHIVLQLGQTDKRMYVTDLESSNGTLLNGKKLNANEPQALYNGDEISLSQVNLRWKALIGLDSQDDSTVHSVEGRTKQLKVVENDKPEETW